ncbi:MAG: hypothetical protein ABI612_20945 [Betaproteobacteria bacterium]
MAADSGVSAPNTSDEVELEKLHREIVTMIGQPRCVNLVHCRVLPLGSRPCGGPAEYLAYASSANREVLESKAYEYGFLQEEIQRSRGTAGVCQVLAAPRVDCVDGRCILTAP